MITYRFTLRKLEMVEAVVRHRSMMAAAKAVAVSQPALTQMIKSIEVSLGVQLFRRGPRGLEPTVYVPPVLRHLREIRSEIAAAKRELRKFAAQQHDKVILL